MLSTGPAAVRAAATAALAAGKSVSEAAGGVAVPASTGTQRSVETGTPMQLPRASSTRSEGGCHPRLTTVVGSWPPLALAAETAESAPNVSWMAPENRAESLIGVEGAAVAEPVVLPVCVVVPVRVDVAVCSGAQARDTARSGSQASLHRNNRGRALLSNNQQQHFSPVSL